MQYLRLVLSTARSNVPIKPRLINAKINRPTPTKIVPSHLGVNNFLPFRSVGITALIAHCPPIAQKKWIKAKNKSMLVMIIDNTKIIG